MHETPDIREVLQRYIKGECSIEEVLLLKQWFELVQQEVDDPSPLTAADEERLVKNLYNDTRFANVAERPQAQRFWLLRPEWRAAAVWMGIVLLCGWLVQRGMHTRAEIKKTVAEQPVYASVTTGHGQQKKISLPDGSQVWLNADSRLSYHPDFVHNRLLQLSGEAFFSVVRDVEHPFIVQAGNAVTHVYGTQFNIYAYPGAKELRVGLQRGKIGVVRDTAVQEEKVLSPGQLLIYNKTTGAQQLASLPPGEIGGWTNGKLVFYKTPLSELLFQLQLKYGVHIVCSRNALKETRVTARFSHISLPTLLHHLSFGWDLQFNRSKDTLYIK